MPLTSKPSNYNLRSESTRQATSTEQRVTVDRQPSAAEAAQVPAPVSRQPPVVPAVEVECQPMAGVFIIESFKGNGTQDINQYLKRYEQYVACTGVKPDQALSVLVWNLDDVARFWYDALTTVPTTLNELTVLLKQKFTREQSLDQLSILRSTREGRIP